MNKILIRGKTKFVNSNSVKDSKKRLNKARRWDAISSDKMPDQSELISVIIPVYNVRPYLQEAINSVLNQSYQNLEIILIDDGSTDGSGKICDAYAKRDSRIRVFHQTNRGLSVARNAGIDRCRGEMIAFLDSDDAYCKDMLQKMSDAMRRSGADIVECNYVVFHEKHSMNPRKIRGKQKGIRRVYCEGLYQRPAASRMLLNEKMSVCVWNKLFRRLIWDSLRFQEGHDYEDLDLTPSLIEKAESVYILDDALVLHRRRSGSITSTYSYANIRDHAMAYQHFVEHVRQNVPEYFTVSDLRRISENFYCSLLRDYYVVSAR